MNNIIKTSALNKTWILDIDGTIVKHNGYKIDGYDTILEGALEFLTSIPENDLIVFITSRSKKHKDITIRFLNENKIRFDYIIFEAPYGERILINDKKPSGLNMSVAINTFRDSFCNVKFEIDESL